MVLEVSGLDCRVGNGKYLEEGYGEVVVGVVKYVSKSDEFSGSREVFSRCRASVWWVG